jgi:hypothetical protein
MKKPNDITLIAPCGIYCGDCGAYRVKDDPSLGEALKKFKFNWDGVPCPGCRQAKGNCQFVEDTCETYACIDGRGHDFCFECSDFPCDMLNPAADRAAVLPHNLKVFNLSTIQHQGVTKFLERVVEIKQRYFRGAMVIGKGPQVK